MSTTQQKSSELQVQADFKSAEVMHITCNMGTHDLPDMHSLSTRAYSPQASDTHIKQIPCAHVTTITRTIPNSL